MKFLNGALLIMPLLHLLTARNVNSKVDHTKHTIDIEPISHHSMNSKRSEHLNNIALDIDKSNSIFNTYLRDVPLIYSNLENPDNEIVLLSLSDYDIHRLGYKIWQYPKTITNDMTEMEKENIIKENVIDFINDYMFNLKSPTNNIRLTPFIYWLENNQDQNTIILHNENGKPISFQKTADGKVNLDNGYQNVLVEIVYKIYENGIVFPINGCFDKKIWN
ncbi:hypothetical protein QEN19_001131 [Hanseniaspora menglaensis]